MLICDMLKFIEDHPEIDIYKQSFYFEDKDEGLYSFGTIYQDSDGDILLSERV